MVAPGASVGPRPLVLVIHNYQGLKQFDRDVAEYFARLGYVGLAIDMYGDRVPSDEREFPTDPRRVEAFQTKCFEAMVWLDHDPELFRALLEAWINAGKAEACVNDAVAPAAIGYCFGGMAVLEGVRGGLDLSAVVSFHGLLQTGEDPSPARFGAVRPPLKPIPNDYNTETIVLIENGAEDHLVLQAHKDRFFAEMDGAGVDWCFVDHAKTPHGFALPSRIGPPGHLHEGADRRSTQNMLSLLREVFPDVEQAKVDRNAAGTKIP
jgi:dienelactone hydrolase